MNSVFFDCKELTFILFIKSKQFSEKKRNYFNSTQKFLFNKKLFLERGENCLPNKKAYPYPQGGNQWKCSQVEKIEQRLKKITNISHEFLLQNTKIFLKVVKTDFQDSLISSGFRTTQDERVNGHNYTKFSAGLRVAPQNSRIRSNIYDITGSTLRSNISPLKMLAQDESLI